jgi:hypothetical protein
MLGALVLSYHESRVTYIYGETKNFQFHASALINLQNGVARPLNLF